MVCVPCIEYLNNIQHTVDKNKVVCLPAKRIICDITGSTEGYNL